MIIRTLSVEMEQVGAPPETVAMLEEIGKGKRCTESSRRVEMVADPELDEFMDSYCVVLERYKEELTKPFDEAAAFLTGVEAQLRSLCTTTAATTSGKKHHEFMHFFY